MSEYAKRSRAYRAAYRQARPLAILAARILWGAIYKKILPYPDHAGACVDCGKPARCYDHRDYTKPLEVEPVCVGCNVKRGPAHPYIDAPPIGRLVRAKAHRHIRDGA